MSKPKPINVERVRELFEYRDGQLFWKVSRGRGGGAAPAGSRAGWINKDCYRYVIIDNRAFKEHRVIYALCHGADPAHMQVDHIDGDRANNCIDNLRLATAAQNKRNLNGLARRNTSGFRGVHWHKKNNKWCARAKYAGKIIHGGYFTDKQEAANRASELRRQYYGEFAGNG